jgi:hypothetical protein
MKQSIYKLAGILLLGAGVTTNINSAVLDRVGPCAGPPETQSGEGALVVYSCWDFHEAIDYDNVGRAAYDVYANNNALLRHVKNDVGGFDRIPVRLSLSAGEYTISSFVPRDGQVRVPILIQPGQTTIVYLDGSGNRLKKSRPAESLVCLPDGDVAGCNGELSGKRVALGIAEQSIGMPHTGSSTYRISRTLRAARQNP